MTKGKVEITPSTKVHDLLKTYPELEEVLIGMAPPFKKLKNPLLRKTVARVASMKHISAVGKIPLNELLNKLRKAVGQPEISDSYEDEEYFGEQPEWFSSDKIAASVVEEKLENKDEMPLLTILREAKNVRKGEIIELITTFLPAPGIDIMKSKGYSAWTLKEKDDLIKTYFLKNSD